MLKDLICLSIFLEKNIPENFSCKVENLHSTDDGKSSSQLSPAIILMSGVAHDGGTVQIDLFTRGSQNLVSGKLRSSGFWRYGQFFK